jgi:hypothetical protein
MFSHQQANMQQHYYALCTFLGGWIDVQWKLMMVFPQIHCVNFRGCSSFICRKGITGDMLNQFKAKQDNLDISLMMNRSCMDEKMKQKVQFYLRLSSPFHVLLNFFLP